MAKLSAIQLTTTPNVDHNLETIDRLLSQLPHDDEHLVLLPECCLFFGGRDAEQLALAKKSGSEKHNSLVSQLANLAQRHKLYLVAGTIPCLTANTDKFYNRSYVFSPQGQTLCYYDKIHLFDVVVEDSEKNYLESKYTQAGNEVKHIDLPFATLGLTVCYDLRFPELYRVLSQRGVDVITVPAAFTKVTGQAHWQALLQARAIENQCYIVAAGQQGKHANGRETWGHSMVISPWGEVLACVPEGEGSVTVDFSLKSIDKIRQSMPVNTHNQFKTELIK
ncbi:carbon-nitrogen hydrolase family protein [Thalassotalea sp. LPB0316]|uniref:carbon-nitrogen hydrolase family protein n=1 Tax=Thalassotalea sp. LPB0316 TaxID=2769490 RepID=UPI001865BDD0|nr:carbon-nitrogen hydrolase family protein [Thalassotalea sp. LPB0316]QOL26762.1 carbon-nitrogen hydrolase family protein [Thalassotalea sp. LPB0316]